MNDKFVIFFPECKGNMKKKRREKKRLQTLKTNRWPTCKLLLFLNEILEKVEKTYNYNKRAFSSYST